MNAVVKSLFAASLLFGQLTAFAQMPDYYEPGGVNPLDKKTDFLGNHLIALSEIKTDTATQKFIAVVPAIGSKRIIIYEINPNTNALVESSTLTDHLDAPFFITFDPSGQYLYAMSSKANFITRYAYDPLKKKFGPPTKEPTNWGTQLPCAQQHLFVFDYHRSLQFLSASDKAYTTCDDSDMGLHVASYDFNKNAGTLERVETLGRHLGESANVSTALIDPSGKYVYIVDDKNVWHQYVLSKDRRFEPTHYKFATHASKTLFAEFDPSGKYVYALKHDSEGESVIQQYQFDKSSGKLEKVDSVHIADQSFTQRAHAVDILFAPKGQFAYVLDSSNNVIYQYRVHADTGKLTALNPAYFATCSVIRSMVFDSHSDYVYAAASNRANVKPSNAKACGAVLMHDPYELHVDRLVMDPATGQLSIFMPH